MTQTISVRIPAQTREAASRVAEQTGESVIAVIARAVKQAEADLFYQRLAEASARTFDDPVNAEDYMRENGPWMDSDLTGTLEPEEKFWK